MRILMVWDGDYPWDIRVEKFCNALIESGDEVHLVCRNLGRKVREELYKGIHIHRLPFLPRLLGRLNAAFTFPAFFSPVWLSSIYRHARRSSCDVIIVRDLPMAPAAILIGKLLRRPVIMDMAECYPEMLRSRWQHQKASMIDRLVRNPSLADVVERWVVRRLDAVLVVVQEAAERMLQLGVDRTRVFVVSNTPEKNRFDAPPMPVAVDVRRSLEVIYVGLVNASRGLDTVIDAVEIYAKAGGKMTLRVVGSGSQSAFLAETVKARGLQQHVALEGWIDSAQVPALVSQADAGIVPHHATSHWRNTIPNKLFDYMAAGKPVISTDIAPVSRVIEDARSGFVYGDYDAAALAVIFGKLEDRALCRELGTNGRRAVLDRYNWDVEKPVIMAALRRVIPR